MDLPSVAEGAERPYISTGDPPAPESCASGWPTAVSISGSDTDRKKPSCRRRSPFPPAFRQSSQIEGDT